MEVWRVGSWELLVCLLLVTLRTGIQSKSVAQSLIAPFTFILEAIHQGGLGRRWCPFPVELKGLLSRHGWTLDFAWPGELCSGNCPHL